MKLDKALFALSVLALAFFYGTAVGKWEWFPHSFIDKAVDQARHVLSQESSGPTWSGARRYDWAGVQTAEPDQVQSGLTLISSSWKKDGKWGPELRLVSEEGQILHTWRVDRGKVFAGGLTHRGNPSGTGIHGSYLFPNGDVLVNLEYVGLVRLNSCGEVLWSLPEGNHHSISRSEDGTFWVPAVYPERRAGSKRYPDGFPGLKGKKVWVDRILRVSEDGEVLEDINVLDVIYRNGLERYIPKVLGGAWPSIEGVNADVTHINDVEALPASMENEYPLFDAGDLVVSLRNLSLVLVFDPETKEVKWHASDPFIYQHDPDFIGDGWIGVFDNNQDLTGGEMLGGSRIVALQPHTDSTKIRFPTQHSEFFYTGTQGKWQQLKNGNMLLTETKTGRVVEVDRRGRTVWEWVHQPIDESRVPSVTEAARYDLTRGEVASWPCSSVDSNRTSARRNQ